MDKYAIPNLVKAVDILRLLAAHPQGLSAVTLERQAGVPRTTAFRILRTLLGAGMAQKQGRLYTAGPGLVEVGLQALNQLETRQLAVPILLELTTVTGYTSHLAVPSGRHSLIVEVCDSPHPVRVASRPGTSVPMACSSTGKVFLAYLHADHLAEQLEGMPRERRTPHTLVTLAEIEAMTETVRDQGYAVDDREYHDDVRCLAAPVFDLDRRVVAAVGITAPIAHFASAQVPAVAETVKHAARSLSERLGAPPS